MKDDYEKQGTDFLKNTDTNFKVEFLKYGKHFEDDIENRDIYKITLEKAGRAYSFNFGQSINASGKYILLFGDRKGKYKRGDRICSEKEFKKAKYAYSYEGKFYEKNKDFTEPSPYSVLATLQKYEVGSFENFCGEFGYDADSRKAEKIYNAVKEEYQKLQRLYSEQELEEMRKIA